MKQLPWRWFNHRTDIPVWIASGIGRAAAEWAIVERELEELIHLLLDVDIQPARVIVNQMSAQTRFLTAANLMQGLVYHNKLTAAKLTEFTRLKKKIWAAQARRDVLAHGLWTETAGQWWVLKLRQSRDTPELAPEIRSLSRSVIPQQEGVDRNKLKIIAREIVSVAKSIEAFHGSLSALLSPSRYSQPAYTRRRHDYR
jgi:hypothetical protein